jgi:hypothetical protein
MGRFFHFLRDNSGSGYFFSKTKRSTLFLGALLACHRAIASRGFYLRTTTSFNIPFSPA